MKVKDLINKLNKINPELDVYYEGDEEIYGEIKNIKIDENRNTCFFVLEAIYLLNKWK